MTGNISFGQIWLQNYANDTMNAYEMLGIKDLPKDQIPPNVPQLRPTERVWAELKKEYSLMAGQPKQL